MKKIMISLIALAAGMMSFAQGTGVVPAPVEVIRNEGCFVFPSRPELLLSTCSDDGIVRRTDAGMKDEAYSLEVTPAGITVVSKDDRGAFYALQTLRLMLQDSCTDSTSRTCYVPSVKIYDEPRFGYRGFMLDVARYFMPKEELLKLIDCMAMLKLNKLHLHLTDDNGWRIEIRKYPRLHEIGSRRVARPGEYFSERLNARPGEETCPGGYYTQDDIREIVSYAGERQIEVIPEIEMPAHSNAALAAYPELACPVVDKHISVLPGLGGDHADIIFCAGNEAVYDFIEDILDEVLELFPSRMIHLGGDEAWKTYWKQCPLCQERIREEKLADEEALQGYFMSRIAEYVQSKGREVAGWDELANTDIPEGAVLFGWRGDGQAAVEAAKLGHRFVMTPAKVTYLIRYQGPQWFEPRTYFGNNLLSGIYAYEPVGNDWTPEQENLLLGVQASLWTEFCSSPEDVFYLAFPRLAALAEIGWTEKGKKDWDAFLPRLDNYVAHVAELGVVSARSMFNVQHTVRPCGKKLQVTLECERTDVVLRYTVDGTDPSSASPVYEGPLDIYTDTVLKCASFKNGDMQGKILTLPVSWNKATASEVSGRNGYDVLVNGVRGSLYRSDSEWVKIPDDGKGAILLDLGCMTEISEISVGCLNDFGMALHLPAEMEFSVSADGKDFRDAGAWILDEEKYFASGAFTEDVSISLDKPVEVRYIRIRTYGQGMTPSGHCRPGKPAGIYFDEIMVR